MQPRTLCVQQVTQSVTRGIPTRSVGTIITMRFCMKKIRNLLGGSLLALAVLTQPTQAAEAIKPIHFGDITSLRWRL